MSLAGELFGDVAAPRSIHAAFVDGLGDVYCSSDEAKAGGAMVTTLQAMFSQAGSPSEFKPQVDALVAEWHKWEAAIIFYNNCDAKNIGARAETLANQIAGKYNLAPVVPDPTLQPGPTSPSQIVSVIEKVVGLAALGLALYFVGTHMHSSSSESSERHAP